MIVMAWHNIEGPAEDSSPTEPEGLVHIESVEIIDAACDDLEVRIVYREFVDSRLE